MTWKCKTCGETHENQFDSCWKCGTQRDGSGAIEDFEIQESQSITEGMKLPCSTTPEIPGRKIKTGKGIVCGEAIMGANVLRDLVAGITDIVGGRSGVYEAKLREGREIALEEMMNEARALGGNAIIGIDIDYETVGNSMMMVSASGTAVVLEPLPFEQAMPDNPEPLPDSDPTDSPWPGPCI
jgi:uncharacterized protein YbjQ (UPF0145 family)